MRIRRIDDAIERCGQHLSAAGSIEKIDDFLAQFLLMLIYSEFENKFRNLITERCSSVTDEPVKKYIGNCTPKVSRSLRLNDVSDTLLLFGQIHKKEFRRRCDENRQVESMYSSIVTNRNKVAHGAGTDATLEDVKQYYEEGHKVLDYFKDALWVEDDDGARNRH